MKIVRTLRIVTGLILFAFVFLHLLNLAFGLKSIEAMEQARKVLMLPWSNMIGGPILMLSLIIHMLMGLYSLYRRNTLNLSLFDGFQLWLGVAIPFLLAPHMITMIASNILLETPPNYPQILTVFWVLAPSLGIQQVCGVMAVWFHGCMGLFMWMRVQSFWPRASTFVYPTFVLIPILALFGFAEAGKEVMALYPATDPAPTMQSTLPAGFGRVMPLIDKTMLIITALILLTLLLRHFRVNFKSGQVTVTYASGHSQTVGQGPSILEISRLSQIDHGSLCGGKGRCGTCRVQVISGIENLPKPNKIEQAFLTRSNATEDIRLACQSIPISGEVVVRRVLPRPATPDDVKRTQAPAAGVLQ